MLPLSKLALSSPHQIIFRFCTDSLFCYYYSQFLFCCYCYAPSPHQQSSGQILYHSINDLSLSLSLTLSHLEQRESILSLLLFDMSLLSSEMEKI